MKYQAGDQVIFSWNKKIYLGTIVRYVRRTMDNIYLVYFPDGSYTNTNPKEISECFLLRNIENKEVKRIVITI